MELITKTGHIKLKMKKYEKLINLADEVNKNKVKDFHGSVSDGFECTLYYKEGVYKIFSNVQSESFYELMREMIHLCPIDYIPNNGA